METYVTGKIDRRQSGDICTKCGAQDPANDCSFFVKSKHGERCTHLRFEFMCDNITDKGDK